MANFLRGDGIFAAPAIGDISGLRSGLGYEMDGGGSVLTTGVRGYQMIPFDCTISEADLLASQQGSLVIDIWRCTYAQFDAGATHPVAGDSITAAARPTLVNATKYTDAVLPGWTTALSRNDILAFVVVSVTSVSHATLTLAFTR